MATYLRLGEIPRKRHQVFRQPDGKLYTEELMGNKGFVGPSSLLYHLRPPTEVREIRTHSRLQWLVEADRRLCHRHFRAHRVPSFGPSPVLDRKPLLFNADVALSIAKPTAHDDFFYRNAQGDEVVYVSGGEGALESLYGSLPVRQGDYVVIPRGILHRWRLAGPSILFIIESTSEVRIPKRYRNEYGQLLESAPYSERDLRGPASLDVHDEAGEFQVLVKKDNQLVEFTLDHHPFDVVGWDGYYYPWIFNIHDFEPRVGRFHLPPPVHQTFEGDGFVVCSFCPRPYDFDELSVPAPYNHSNVMSDEVIYYANAEFMSRKGIEYGSVTLHPDGIPHGPQPGRTEASIGAKRTNELAVMVDTFRPMLIGEGALAVEDEDYFRSWLSR